MIENHTSQLVVVDHRGRSVGLISKRDIARFLLEDTSNRSLDAIHVTEASSKSLSTIRLDTEIVKAARFFDTDNLAYAVVTNEQPLHGIVTETDLCRYFSEQARGRFSVIDFMEGDFVFAKSTYPAVHVANAIIFRQPSVPVIDEQLVGILTLSDILSIKEKIPHNGNGRLSAHEETAALITTRDIMTRNPITTTESSDLAQAAETMIANGIGSLPVLECDQQVVGLLSKHDIVRALGRVDGNLFVEA